MTLESEPILFWTWMFGLPGVPGSGAFWYFLQAAGLLSLIALLLRVVGWSADIKNHTIYTIVTKPVRPGEIVLGRILGFSVIGTLMLAIMGLFSYFFVSRVLNHTHEVEVASLKTPPNDHTG